MEKFIMVKDNIKKVRRFNLSGRSLEFKIKPVPNDAEPVGWIKDAVTQIIEKGTENLEPQDLVGFTFCSRDFQKGEGWMRFKEATKVNVDDVWETISSIYQSNSIGLNTETFCLGVTSIKMPVGQGRGRKFNSFKEESTVRRGIITIDNQDTLCLPRAVVVALAFIECDPEYAKIRLDTGKMQIEKALKLLKESNIRIHETGAGIAELQQFQNYLEGYKLTVYLYGNKGRDVMFEGAKSGKPLNLLYHDGHFNVITSLTAAFCCSYYCEVCHIPYDHKERHRCGGTCASCQQSPACSKDRLQINCDDCKRSFRGEECFINHKNYNICTQIRRCECCFKIHPTNRQHICGEVFCKICKTHVPMDHLCYMPVDKRSPKTDDTIFLFYDLETTQEKELKDGSHLHEANLCVFRQYCDHCIDEEKLFFCQKCGYRQTILTENVISSFMEYIVKIRKKFKKIIVLAHNGGGYDNQFILNYILTKTDVKPDLIMRGTKLISMTLDNVTFLDSLNYFPMALSRLPKTFGITELKKGYFPHLFNTIENQTYIGPIPDINYFDPDNLKPEDRQELVKWYAEKVAENYIFNFKQEIIEYCISDVNILAQACLKFRQLMLLEGNVCPFSESSTLPGACNKIFRRMFLKPGTIGLIPRGGYRWIDNQSKLAIQWLLHEEYQRQINIIHAAKHKEARVGGVKVDGFCSETNQVFEFHGCYYHGCPQCFKYERNKPLIDNSSESLEYRYEATVAKTTRLKNLGYSVTEMWECDFRRLMTDKVVGYTETHPLIKYLPLNPRDAFYGGRTGNVKAHYKIKDAEQIKYVDFTSLYPYVNKYCKYPVGHPKVYVGDECHQLNLKEINGIIKCKILPNQRLFHPVLPTKMNDRLMFVLCRSCGENFNQNHCDHDDNERALSGTWVIDEVQKAVEKGYKILDIYEIWQYNVEQYNIETKSGGLFHEYIDKFLTIKQEASGWPVTCDTSEKKDKYIKEYFKMEGVSLNPTKIEKNPGLRQLGKSVITSFWGKLGQRENQSKTSIVRQPGEFYNMLTNPGIEINTILPINEDTLVVNWIYKEECCDILPTVNVVLAAYTTTHARLKLYEYLEKLEERVLYYDTDSIIYISRPGQYEPPLGQLLGELTDELEGEGVGSYITDFVSGGPKNYAYKVWSTSNQCEIVICKVKGISLTYAASQLINFDQIKKMVLEEGDPVLVTTKLIRRTKEHEIITVKGTKLYQLNSKKRRFFQDGSSYPYGFKRFKEAAKIPNKPAIDVTDMENVNK